MIEGSGSQQVTGHTAWSKWVVLSGPDGGMVEDCCGLRWVLYFENLESRRYDERSYSWY